MNTLLIKPAGIEGKIDDKSLPLFAFSNLAVQNQEILDKEVFGKELNDYLGKTGIPSATVDLIISKDLLYQKKIGKDELESNFLSLIPLKEDQVSKIKIPEEDGGFLVVATNKDIYQTVIGVLEKKGWHVREVRPEGMVASFTKAENTNKNSKIKPIIIGAIILVIIILIAINLLPKP